jgi:hypothetical protein
MRNIKAMLPNTWKKSLIVITMLVIVWIAGYQVGGSIGELIYNLKH